MANSQEWFEIPHRSCIATTAIYQVGQVLTDPLDLDSALFRNGSFNGMSSYELSRTIRQNNAFTVKYSKTASSFEITTGHTTVIEGARIDGKGAPVLWQVLEEERIYRNDSLLRAVVQEEEIIRYLARHSDRKRLYLVTNVIKVQEIFPEYYEPGKLQPPQNPPISTYTSPYAYPYRPPSPHPTSFAHFSAPFISEDLHLPVGFEGRKNGKPFVWKYKLECINNSQDFESVFAERYFPSQAISDQNQTTWMILVMTFFLRWMWLPSKQETVHNEGARDSRALLVRPTTLEWRVEHENLTQGPIEEPNVIFPQKVHYGLEPPLNVPPPWPPLLWQQQKSQPHKFSGARTVDEVSLYSDGADDDNIRPPTRAYSTTDDPTWQHLRIRRRTSEGGEPVDSSDEDSWSRSVPYPPSRRRRFGPKLKESTAFAAMEPIRTGPDTAETAVGMEPVEIASLPGGLENGKVAEKDSQNMGIKEVLGEVQAMVIGAGNHETAVESKAEHIGEHSSVKLPAVPAMPALNSPTVGATRMEYDVFDSEAANLASVLTQGDEAIKEGKKWFDDAEYMKKANNFLQELRSGRSNERVKIAVLDTGLDFDHPLMRQFLESKQLSSEHSLDFTLEPNIPVKDDRVGHGTHCTHLILKTCETAEVYVAKVFKKKKADKYTAACVAKAIDHAVHKWKVDIISMSFAFNEEQGPIKEAIERAQKGENKVLFLAAASNFRPLAHYPVGFPANHQHVISVFSHTLNRERSKFSPKRPGVQNFSVLGEHLNAAFPKALNEGDYERRESGTSMATALMAGIAGLVIEFSRLRAIPENVTDPDRLLTRTGMEAVFRLMIPQQEQRSSDADEYLYLRPWILFRAPKATDPWNMVYEINKALVSSAQSG